MHLQIKRLGSWLAEARYFWVAFAVVATSLIASLRPQTTESFIRLTGLILQLLGIATVAWGISETRSLFGHPSVTSMLKGWIDRFPLMPRKAVVGSMNGTLPMMRVDARGGPSMYGPSIPPTTESRISSLEKNVLILQDRIKQTQEMLEMEAGKAAEALKSETQCRAEEDTSIRATLEATGTGGVHISAIGAVWLFVGVILSTAGVEIAAWLK